MIGLQLHDGKPPIVSFSNIRVKGCDKQSEEFALSVSASIVNRDILPKCYRATKHRVF